MSSNPTRTDFGRLEERLEEKIDRLTHAVSKLVIFEERQAQQAARFGEIASALGAQRDALASQRENFEKRIAAMAERFDEKVQQLDTRHQATREQMQAYVNRYTGAVAVVSVIASAGLTLGAKLLG